MPTVGPPGLPVLQTASSLLLRPWSEGGIAASLGPILILQAPGSAPDRLSHWGCPPDRLQLRWQETASGEITGLSLDPPGWTALPSGHSWTLQVPLEHLLLAADHQGLALALNLDTGRDLDAEGTETAALVTNLAALGRHARAGDTEAWLGLECQLLDQIVEQCVHRPGEGNTGPRQDRGWQHVLETLRRMGQQIGEPLTLTDLSAATGVSPRALQMAYRRHLHKRPLQSLRELRLAELRRRLLAANAHGLLAREVVRCGLPANGTTTRHYQERYQEKPSQTRP